MEVKNARSSKDYIQCSKVFRSISHLALVIRSVRLELYVHVCFRKTKKKLKRLTVNLSFI